MSKESRSEGRSSDGKVKGPGSGRNASRDGTGRKLMFWEDLQDLIMAQIDVLVVLLILTAVLTPIIWLVWGDIALMVGYAALLTFIAFIAFYASLVLTEHRLARLEGHPSEMTAGKKAGKK